jgi:RHS repeat-associated protein
LGSSLGLSNAQGISAVSYTYEPFGKTTVTGSSANALQYTGRENDGTGLYYYRVRYYHPRLQRFIGQDPARFGGGDMNLYSYVFNNPIRFIDPNGLLASPWHFIISYGAMRASGHCFGESIVTAWDDAMTDFRPSYKESQSAGNANQHAMATPRQSLAAAQAGIQSMINQQLAGGNMGGALHTNEDKYSRSHGPDKQWNGDFDGWADFLRHQIDDWFPSWNYINQAAQTDMDIIQQADLMNGRKPRSNNTCSP